MFKDLSASNLQVFGNLGTVDSSGHGMFKDLSAANLQVFGNLGTVDSSGHGMFKDLSASKGFFYENLKVPKGTTSERPTATSSLHHGYIRYNTTLKTFEGFAEGNVWKSLDSGGGGGVIDSDQDTYITAEDVTGGDDDELKFYTAGNVMARIDTSKFDVSCGMTIGSGTNFSGTASPPSNGLLVEGIVGIGATDVFGALQVGNASTAIGGTDITADVSNSLIVIQPTPTSNTAIDDPKTALYLGRIGTTNQANPTGVFFKVCRSSNTGTNSKSRLDINLRTNWTSQSHVMTLLDSGNVGIGTTTPQSKLDVEGGVAIGSTYSGTTAAPSNGMIVEGNVGIGTTSSTSTLNLHKQLTESGTYPAADIKFSTENTGGDNWDMASIESYVKANNDTINNYPGGLAFKTKTADGNTATEVSTKMVLDASGFLGIGTTTPEELVEAKGNLYLSNYVNNGSTRTGGKLFFDASFDTGGIGAEGPQKIDLYGKQGHYGFGIEGSTTTYFSTNKHKWYTTDGTTATARMMLDSDKLGIGTNSPGTMLQIEGTDAYITLKNSTAENTDGGAETKIIFEDHSDTTLAQIQASHDGTSDDTKGDFIISTNNGSSLTEALRIDSSQYVGIGNTSPSYKLDVTGDINFTGNLRVSGTVFGLNHLSDVLVENNSLFIGTEPSSTNGAVDNVSVGINALESITTGDDNIAIGKQALKSSTTDSYNTAVGYRSMYTTNGGGTNTALGHSTLYSNVSGGQNVAIGYGALYSATGGSNTAVGYEAGEDNAAGTNNTSVGRHANNTGTGSYNTTIGANAGTIDSYSGSNNVLIGYNAEPHAAAGTNQIVIGYNATGVANDSVTLGNDSVTAVYMAEDKGATVHAGGFTMYSSGSSVYSLPTADGTNGQALVTNGSGTLSFSTISSGSSTWSSSTNSAIYYNSGFVGINKTYPKVPLEIYRNDSDNDTLVAKFSAGTTNGNHAFLGFGTNSAATFDTDGASTWAKAAIGYKVTDTYERGTIGFYTNNDATTYTLDSTDLKMVVDSSGNVGIGTDSPYNSLTINGPNTHTATSDSVPILGLRSGNASGTFNNGAQIAFGYNGAANYQHFIHTRHNSSSSNNAIDFYVSDGTASNTVTSGSIHTMSLVSGYVGIGVTGPMYKLDVAGDINFTGTLYQNGSAFSSGGASSLNDLTDVYFDSNSSRNNLFVGSNPSSIQNGAGSNTATGVSALDSITSGDDNTAFGKDALTALASGHRNTAIGSKALQSATYRNNTGIGNQAGSNLLGGQNNIMIGFNAQGSSTGISNEITLGDSNISTLRCKASSITALSDIRDKKNIVKIIRH